METFIYKHGNAPVRLTIHVRNAELIRSFKIISEKNRKYRSNIDFKKSLFKQLRNKTVKIILKQEVSYQVPCSK